MISNATISLVNNVTHLENSSTDPASIDDLLDDKSFLIANTICCCILILFEALQYVALGPLRTSELQHLRETFWDYLVQKSLFVLFILDTKTYEERSSWAVWFTTLGSVLLLSKLCKDRSEYLSSSPTPKVWPFFKISILLGFLLIVALSCMAVIPISDFTTHSLYLLAEALFVLTFVLSVITRNIVLMYYRRPNSVLENSATISYYTDLLFSMTMLTIELAHHSHLLIVSHASIIIRGICLTKIHALFMEVRRRYRRHKHYLLVVKLMESNFDIATKEEIQDFGDECAICWDSMETARKLPCGHLFHNSCLRSWLEQDTSCPTCRTSFKGSQPQQNDDLNDLPDDQTESDEEFVESARTQRRNHFFHFDGSRYTNHPFLSWLPTITIDFSF